jgi:hypothetical protein
VSVGLIDIRCGQVVSGLDHDLVCFNSFPPVWPIHPPRNGEQKWPE